MRLANVMAKLINCIQIHDKLDKGRTYHKKLLAFARKNKTSALKERKTAISNAWLSLPGFKQYRALREAKLEQIQQKFFETTNWRRVKSQFEKQLQDESEIREHLEAIHRDRYEQTKDGEWGDDNSKMDFDKSPYDRNSNSEEQDVDHEMADQDMTDTPNGDDESTYSDPHNQAHIKSEIKEQKQDAIITHSADTYLMWGQRINRIIVPDNVKVMLNQTMDRLLHKVRVTSTGAGIEHEILVLFTEFKRKLGRFNERCMLTKDKNELVYRCNLELLARINALERPTDSLCTKNQTVLKKIILELSTKDFQRDKRVSSTALSTAYTNPYLI